MKWPWQKRTRCIYKVPDKYAPWAFQECRSKERLEHEEWSVPVHMEPCDVSCAGESKCSFVRTIKDDKQ